MEDLTVRKEWSSKACHELTHYVAVFTLRRKHRGKQKKTTKQRHTFEKENEGNKNVGKMLSRNGEAEGNRQKEGEVEREKGGPITVSHPTG